MAAGKIVWDAIGEHIYETGVDHGVLYQVTNAGKYSNGVAWNGLTNVSESPSGAEAQKQYADNMNYLTLYSAEEFGLTVEAFTYPDEFEQNDGSATPSAAPGLSIHMQPRKAFGLCYRTKVGNDVAGDDFGFKLHLVYGCRASPSERGYATINDSPEAISFSWEVTTTPVQMSGYDPMALLTIDSTKMEPGTNGALNERLALLMDVLYGTDGEGQTSGTIATLPLPDVVYGILSGTITTVEAALAA